MINRRTLGLAGPALLLGRAALAGQAGPGWTPLLNGRDFDGWDRIGDANWRVEEGMLVADRGNGMLVSRADYADFQLRVEFWVETATNSGIFIRATDPATVTSANAYEVNIWDERPEPRYGTGAIVNVAAVDPMPKAGGRWNSFDITARGDRFTVILNGQTTVDGARDGKHPRGRIALQHGAGVRDDRAVVRFRKVELRQV